MTTTITEADGLLALKEELAQLRPDEIVAEMGRSNASRRAVMFRLLDKAVAVEVFEDLPPSLASDLTHELQGEELLRLVEELSPDDRVALLDELPAGVAKRILLGLSPGQRRVTAVLMGYADGSVGRRTNPGYVPVSPDLPCGRVLERIAERGAEAETIYALPVVGPSRRLHGMLDLRDALEADPQTPVGEVMHDLLGMPATMGEEEAARELVSQHLAAAGVVDSEGRLIGVLTLDDAVAIVAAAEEEDAARAGGAEPLRQPYLSVRLGHLVRSRFPWLLVLAVSATLTVSVLDIFEDELSMVVALALFIPLLTGTGGNTGSQAATTVTRAIAVGDVEGRDIARVALRELRVGFTMGLLLAALAFVPTMLFADQRLAIVLSVSLLAVCTLSATVGGAMPLIARAIKVDPAVFSAPFISTFCDATGLLIYFYTAKVVLGI